MKKLFLIPIMFVLVSALILGGCGEAAPPEAIKLLYTDHNLATSHGTVHATEVIWDKVEEASDGRVEIERYYSETLAKGVDAYTAVKTGVADMSWAFHGYWPGMTPLSDVIALPFLPLKGAGHAAGILWKLYEKFPEIQQEYADVHVILFNMTTPYFLGTTEKAGPIKTLEDLKGKKLRIIGGPPTEAFERLGAVPTMVAMPECYLAMQKGVIDGMGIPLGAVEIFNLFEVLKHYTHVALYVGYFTIPMNLDKWNSLPSDIQDMFTSVGGYEGSRWYAYNYSDVMWGPVREEMDAWVAGGGHKIEEYTLPREELNRWIEVAGKPVWDKWVADMEAKGLPGKAVLDEALRLCESEPEPKY